MKDKRLKDSSLYQTLSEKARRHAGTAVKSEKIDLARHIRSLREKKELTGATLCRLAGDLNPKTLTSVEKGRIRNPSVKTLLSIARGLGVTVGDLFWQAETEMERNFCSGSQKGAFKMEFPQWGVKVISFTPLIKEFFYGKLILESKRKIQETFLKHPQPFFVSTLLGRFEIEVAGRSVILKEGDNLFFNGCLKHSFYNPLHRDSVLLFVTAPSFL